MKKNYIVAALALGSSAAAPAAVIGVNFSENDGNQSWLVGASLIGPLDTPAQYFNTTNNPPGVAGLPARTGTLATGNIMNLVDDSGVNTGAAVSWSSSNAWWNSDGTGNDEQRLAVGYLDDGGSGVSITVIDIPYSNYRVIGLLTSDQGNTYTTLDFSVNGTPVLGGTATAFGNIATSLTTTGMEWSPLTTTTVGNYWTSGIQTIDAVTITAPARSGVNRSSITGFIIQEVTPVPEPTTAMLALMAGGVVTFRRRRRQA